MSQLKQLLEKATQKNEMKWRVYAYDPAKDNKLVHTSKTFDCINDAGIEKAELLKKNPDYTIEIIAESANIDVKNPGVLEVPDGKKVDELPQSHFEKLVDKKGYAEVIRALTNLEVWNKDKNKSLSSWASNMADKLKKKFRPESAQINEDKQSEELDELIYHINDRILQLDTVHKMRHDDLAKAINANDLSKIKSILANCRSYIIAKDIVDSFDRAKKLANTMKEFSLESAQMNETRSYTVTVKLEVPDKMNNRDIENYIENRVDNSNFGVYVLDVTAERA